MQVVASPEVQDCYSEALALMPQHFLLHKLKYSCLNLSFLPELPLQVVAPPEVQDCYSEALALMPHCYFVNDYKRAHADVLDEVRFGHASAAACGKCR